MILRFGGSRPVRRGRSGIAAIRGAVSRVLVVVAIGFLAVRGATAAETKNVLVLYSNHRLLPANIEADRGLREAIVSTADRPVELFAEFLDRPTFGGETYDQTVATYLREKYATRPPDVIMVGGENALDFALRKRAQLFPNAPIVHMAIPVEHLRSMRPIADDVVGVPLGADSVDTIELALRLHPGTRKLVMVTGTAPWDRAWQARLRDEGARFRNRVELEFIEGLPIDAVVKRLSELGPDAVVFTPAFFRDGEGRAFVPRETVVIMAGASGAPVYGPASTFIGTGVVGGRMPTYFAIALQAAQAVNELLGGATPASLRLPEYMPAEVNLDWRQVRRWGIDDKTIPRDAVVHFKEPTFWEAYRNEALGIVAVVLLQAALIAALLVERRLRRRTAASLEESEKRMNLAARAAKLSMWVWEVARDRIWTTTHLRQQAGLPKEPPTDFKDILANVYPADRDRVERAMRQAAANNEELDVEYRGIGPDGDVRWFSARGRAEKGNGLRLLGVTQDITARKTAELQAEADRSALTHMTRVSMMGQLSASIAHQLNQPLAAILGNAEAARKMLGREHVDLVELREICDDIVTEDNRAADVIRRLGALYKRGELKLAPLDLNELVRETLDLVRTEFMTRQVDIATDLAPALPAIDGGRVQMQQVLLNLMINAADAMGATPDTDRVLTIRTGAVSAHVRVCVTDRGTGIASEDVKHIFDAFWSTKPAGMGIGLAICQAIVAAHRGTLTVVNNPGGGTTFCAQLPIRQSEQR